MSIMTCAIMRMSAERLIRVWRDMVIDGEAEGMKTLEEW